MADSLVARLRAAIDETERIAQAATPGPWSVDSDIHAEIIYGDGDNVAVVAGGRWGGEASVFDSTADALHIVRHDPDRVLRRCAADRKILDLHEVLVSADVPGLPTEYACAICEVDNYEGPFYGPEQGCATVRALAEAYGVEA